MKVNFHRAHARWPCEVPVQILEVRGKAKAIGRGLLIDVSLSGALLRCGVTLVVGSSYRLRASVGDSLPEFAFRVTRDASSHGRKKSGDRHYGLSFDLTLEEQQRLRLMIDMLPREDTLKDDVRERSARRYWSN